MLSPCDASPVLHAIAAKFIVFVFVMNLLINVILAAHLHSGQ
jgi:hypothetical protein